MNTANEFWKARRSFGLLAITFAVAAAGCGGGNDNGNSGGNAGAGGGSGGSGAGGTGSQLACHSSGAAAEMVSVPAGSFLMGCNAAVDNQCEPKEKPSRQITLSAYQIDKTEVTQDQYAACVEDGACASPSCDWDCGQATLPATCLNYNDAKDYCAWAGKRLPTEAEWEKAARGTDGRKYPWGNTEPTCAAVNMKDCNSGPTPAGSLGAGASPYGALDMAGNMVELVADYYDENYYQTMPANDPKGPASGSKYVGRGGGWKSDAFWQRTSTRDWYVATDAGKSLGFRCAK